MTNIICGWSVPRTKRWRLVANRIAEIDGGWVLASGGAILAEVRYEIGD